MSAEMRRSSIAPVPIKNIERELICPICKELFTHPLILPCQHSVCHKCVRELLMLNHEDSFDAGSECSMPGSPRSRVPSPSMERLDRLVRSGGSRATVRRSLGSRGRRGIRFLNSCSSPRKRSGNTGLQTEINPALLSSPLSQKRSISSPGWRRGSVTPRVTTIPCPGCQHDIDLGERGISMLFRNFTLENIVERYRQAARAAVAIMCNICKPPQQEATKSCMDCKASYCNECFKLHHPWGTPKAQHEYVGPTTNFRPKVLMCPEHEMEKVNMYCEVCKRPVCHLCKLGGSHANHKVTSMGSAYKILKEKLAKSIHYLISKEDQVRAQITDLDLLINQTEDNGQLAERQANEHFERLFETLQERKSEMLKSIEQSRNRRLDQLKVQVEEYQGMLENSGLVGYAQEVLKETDHSCFVQTAKQLHTRIQKATESLRTFHPASDPCFDEFVLDTSREEMLLKEMCFGGVPDPPLIDLSTSRVYNEALICWRLSDDHLPTDHHVMEYRRLGGPSQSPSQEDGEDSGAWRATDRVYGPNTVVCDLEPDSLYSFRVKSCRNSMFSPHSPEVTFHTPPAPAFGFLFSDKCGFSTERLILNKRRDTVESVASMAFLLAAERVQTGSFIGLDYIIGDMGISQGRHYWAFKVEPYSYMVKFGVASDSKLLEWFHNPRDTSSPRYDHDSGHDSGSEDTCYELSQPFTLLTLGMGKLFIPKTSSSSSVSTAHAASSDPGNRVLPLPQRIGVCLDYDACRVYFYDADTMRCLYERQVDCSGTMYPAFGLMGSGKIQLEEFITAKRLTF
ncbi:E3 ubiquitin-protein ligase TRIM36 isoform X3 [Notothenia coriiceps]|uniref:E3 ubiquitin-protein ligase TRIM36 isoform X3 n=1 Tax=Notothenia coriiceps TaxID=8208 RepID=A0A6I9N953_9TELE|nr:PREDICTED: E3 ubiquitin-protein ligase TRIM36 isoform X3 [Notothenia coriiceps]